MPGKKTVLQEFAQSLGAWNCISEPGIGAGEDDGRTRQEATLLMSLSTATPDGIETDSSSEASAYSRKEEFRFTCPSLSLERTTSVSSPSLIRRVSQQSPSPDVLLRRPLTVEDRDALLLNADAMARNILQSYQKAMEWRIQVWTAALSRTLVAEEKSRIAQGASEEELKELCELPEALLLLALREVGKRIHVTGAGTTFRVQGECSEDTCTDRPPIKKARTESSQPEFLDNVTVKHDVVLDCFVTLHTPAGHSEITLEVPGTMEGVFVRGESFTDDITSVVIDLNTEILAAMMEKSCRKIVRLSTQSLLEHDISPSDSPPSSPQTERQLLPLTDEAVKDTPQSSPSTSLSPSRLSFRESHQHDDFSAVMVTPPARVSTIRKRSNAAVMMPIPDEFDDEPRRISPSDSLWSTPYTPIGRLPRSGLALVSPPPGDSHEYNETNDNEPSLPMLVEAACRAMQAN